MSTVNGVQAVRNDPHCVIVFSQVTQPRMAAGGGGKTFQGHKRRIPAVGAYFAYARALA